MIGLVSCVTTLLAFGKTELHIGILDHAPADLLASSRRNRVELSLLAVSLP